MISYFAWFDTTVQTGMKKPTIYLIENCLRCQQQLSWMQQLATAATLAANAWVEMRQDTVGWK